MQIDEGPLLSGPFSLLLRTKRFCARVRRYVPDSRLARGNPYRIPSPLGPGRDGLIDPADQGSRESRGLHFQSHPFADPDQLPCVP